ncbi:MAG TPA: hypothetical protein VML55_13430 [Planctomycetaceae bacterium]|nr:hypothetical protein [Planctomycetaceae bacterium]
MSVSITLDDQLANQLIRQAEGRDLSLQEWAVSILRDAANGHPTPEAWSRLQARRLTLIARQHGAGLSDDEVAELERLQEAVATASEPFDRSLLARLSVLEEQARACGVFTNE